MGEGPEFLAVDLGAASGRIIAGRWDGTGFVLDEVHRFPNGPVAVQGRLHWDVLRLWQEIQTGLGRYAASRSAPPAGIGIDTWAVDYGLLDGTGRLLGNPIHYRDGRTAGTLEQVDHHVTPAHLYAQTGIQRLPINTLYQLYSMRAAGDPQLDIARTLLLMPDLFGYWLTGRAVAEYTNATTTGFYDARTGGWAGDLLGMLDLPGTLLPPLLTPGTLLGDLLPAVGADIGWRDPVPVIAVGTHDTASAVAAIPDLDVHSAYISSGTWSLVGVETDRPVLTEQARALNFTNEGGVGGTIRLLKNVGGLWLLQECRRQWAREGHAYNWPDLMAQAAHAPMLASLVDPDAPELLNPSDMPAAVCAYCARTGQSAPASVGALVRCCLESLALKYRWVLAALESVTGRRLDTVRVVGGGSRNTLLCRLTADACARRVVAGPVEATALGNILLQALAIGYLPDLAAGRRAVAASVRQTIYEPDPQADWEEASVRFAALLGVPAHGS